MQVRIGVQGEALQEGALGCFRAPPGRARPVLLRGPIAGRGVAENGLSMRQSWPVRQNAIDVRDSLRELLSRFLISPVLFLAAEDHFAWGATDVQSLARLVELAAEAPPNISIGVHQILAEIDLTVDVFAIGASTHG